MSIDQWSTTAATNSTAATGINWAEGQAPSTVNDSARAMMADVAGWYGQAKQNLALTGVAGTNTITATGAAAIAALAANQIFTLIPAATNTGATTLNITPSGGAALTAKNVFQDGAACIGGELRIGVPVALLYDGTQFNIIGERSSGMVLLGTGTASNSSSLDFTSVMDSTLYSGYVAQLQDILPATNAAIFSIRFSANNGGAYDAGTDYISGNANYQTNTASPGWNLAGSATGTAVPITVALSNTVARCVGTAWIYPGAAFTQVIANTNAIANDASSKYFQQSSGDWNNVANAMRFLMSSGNITSGSIRLYGIRK